MQLIVRTLLPILTLALATTGAAQVQYNVSVIAGGGPRPGLAATAANIPDPAGVAWDNAGRFYFTTRSINKVFCVNQAGTIDLVIGSGLAGFAGDGGTATAGTVQLNGPAALAARV